MKIFLTLFLLCIATLSFYTNVDEHAMAIYKNTLDRAVYSFALAKGLNAIISVIQSTEINLSLFVGATVGIGEILDPINDLVERFSIVMLLSSISIGVQHLLLIVGKSMFIKVLLIISAVLSIVGIWMYRFKYSFVFIISIKVFLLLFILRFGAVFFIYSTELMYEEVYEKQYQSSNKYLQTYKNDLEVLRNNKQEFSSLWEQLKGKTETFSKKVIQLMTIFVVTTVLFPMLFLWFFLFLVKIIFNIKFNYDILAKFEKKGQET